MKKIDFPVEDIKSVKKYLKDKMKILIQYAEDKGFAQYIRRKNEK